MPQPLKVVWIGSNNPDTVIAELERGEYTPELTRVGSPEQLQNALEGKPEIAISDFQADGFSAMDALRKIQELSVDLPLIVVSGKIRDADVLAVLKAGAAD